VILENKDPRAYRGWLGSKETREVQDLRALKAFLGLQESKDPRVP